VLALKGIAKLGRFGDRLDLRAWDKSLNLAGNEETIGAAIIDNEYVRGLCLIRVRVFGGAHRYLLARKMRSAISSLSTFNICHESGGGDELLSLCRLDYLTVNCLYTAVSLRT
jgi:hypothetical protein